ncbi:MAG: hypothetical protein Q8O35_09765 [Humidesulfovibrio sp.]|uniref:hypothetical protein n=1 Tax=Humidesulfovibrio sp. TaxID=2910988 RepID=UPI002734825C|nr:hypothetical protein [Humidesulfovibrio sp.]MDP2848467.1 hypothetical protein [Humidesulfovibrio sp.]
MVSHPPKHDSSPDLTQLPFGGLGLDLAEVRRKVSGLVLAPFPTQEAPEQEPHFDAPTALSGYSLLVRLCRETLGS